VNIPLRRDSIRRSYTYLSLLQSICSGERDPRGIARAWPWPCHSAATALGGTPQGATWHAYPCMRRDMPRHVKNRICRFGRKGANYGRNYRGETGSFFPKKLEKHAIWLIVTTTRSPGRADPSFLPIKRGHFYLPRGCKLPK